MTSCATRWLFWVNLVAKSKQASILPTLLPTNLTLLLILNWPVWKPDSSEGSSVEVGLWPVIDLDCIIMAKTPQCRSEFNKWTMPDSGSITVYVQCVHYTCPSCTVSSITCRWSQLFHLFHKVKQEVTNSISFPNQYLIPCDYNVLVSGSVQSLSFHIVHQTMKQGEFLGHTRLYLDLYTRLSLSLWMPSCISVNYIMDFYFF